MKKLVFIKWEDTFGCPAGWEFEEDLNTKTTVIHTVGFVVKETKKKITVSPHIGGLNRKQRQFAGAITIPKRQIISSSFCKEFLKK